MRFLQYVLLLVALCLLAVPLVITAQDGGIIVHPATPMTEELIEYAVTPQSDLLDEDDIPLPPTSASPQSTPVSEAPAIVNGMWVLDPSSSGFTSSGSCQVEGGDNGGMGGYASIEELPKVPACVSADNEWLKVDETGPYPRVMSGVYSQQELVRELLMSGGETSGSVNVTIRRAFSVINPTTIEYSFTRQEEGGCTTTSTMRYILVEVNSLACSGVSLTPDPALVSTPVATLQPGETPQPTATPQPPVEPGRYVVTLPPADGTCTSDKMPPSDIFTVGYDSRQNLFITFGQGSYTLYWDGTDYYEYRKGNQFTLSVVTYPGGASYSWSNQGCFVYGDLVKEGTPTTTPLPPEPTSQAYTDATTMAGSRYRVTWDAPDYACAEADKGSLPDLDSAILTAQDDGNFLFNVDGKDYVLTNADGIHGFMEMGDDGSMLSITMNGFYQGSGMGTFSVVGADGAFCMAQLTFTPTQ